MPNSARGVVATFEQPLSLILAHDLRLDATPAHVGGSTQPDPEREDSLPTPGSYPIQTTRAYHLDIKAALDASIPVGGGGAFGMAQSVIVLERIGYRIRTHSDGTIEQVGFSIRLCVIIKKLEASIKLSIPFIVASAQVGSTEAMWLLQTVGLVGPKIGAVKVQPDHLSVETYVIAKQALEKLIDALTDADTRVIEHVIARQGPATTIEARYAPIVTQATALGCIDRGQSIIDAAREFGWDLAQLPSGLVAVYQDVAGIYSETEKPTAAARAKAMALLGNVKVLKR